MSGRRTRFAGEGLNTEERVTRLESAIRGNEHVAGIVEDLEQLRRRLEDLERADRLRKMPFFLRWFLKGNADDRPTA